jgi:hypothetical protein
MNLSRRFVLASTACLAGIIAAPAILRSQSSLTAAAINAATAQLASNGGGELTLSPAAYVVDEPVLLRPGVFLSGHRTATQLQAVNGYAGPLVQNVPPAIGQSFARDLRLAGVTIKGSGRIGSSIGLSLVHAAESVLEEVRVTNCGLGIEVDDGIMQTFRQAKVVDNGRGAEIRNRANLTSFLQSRIQASDGENLIIKGPNTFTVLVQHCAIESSGLLNPAAGLLIESGVKGLTLDGNHFEANHNIDGGQVVIRNSTPADGASSMMMRGGWLTCAAKSKYAIEALDCLSFVGQGYDTAGHQRTHYLGANARANLLAGLWSDTNVGGLPYEGPGIPYSMIYNDSLYLKNGVELLSTTTSRIKKPNGGNLLIETMPGSKVYINGQQF